MKVEKVQLSERPLIDDYKNNFDRVEEFFTYNPYDNTSFEKRYQYIRENDYPRQEICQTLEEYNRQLGVSEKTLINIERLANQETAVAITGQQAGVLTGPLYTLYKAMTVIQLAHDLTAKGMETVPLFWIASEDHDFYEIAGVNFLNRDYETLEVRLESQIERQPVGRLKPEDDIDEFLAEFEEKTIDTDFKPEMMEKIREMARESEDLGEWFGRIMAWLLEDTGIIFVDSLDPQLRRLGRDFFNQVIDKAEEMTQTLQDTSGRLEEAGYPTQVTKNDGQQHLFFIEDDNRYPLVKDNQDYLLRGLDQTYTIAQIREKINNNPELVSTNVITRPLFQDFIFPTIAYVSGPGETAYFSQYQGIYKLLDMEMPIIYPRASLTIVERTVSKAMDKYDVEPGDVFDNFDDIRQAYLDKNDEFNIDERFNEIKKNFIPEYQQLIEDLRQLDSKFKKLGSKNLGQIIKEIDYLKGKAHHQHRKNSEVLLNRFDKIEKNLLPKNNRQERKLNIFPYLFKYRKNMIDDLLKLDLLSTNIHQFVYL